MVYEIEPSLYVLIICSLIGAVIWIANQYKLNLVKEKTSLIAGSIVVIGMNFFVLAFFRYYLDPPLTILIALGIASGFYTEKIWFGFANFIFSRIGIDINNKESSIKKDNKPEKGGT